MPGAAGGGGGARRRVHAVMQVYSKNPEATEKAMENGWLRTGDIARMDEDGFVSIADRGKDLIIRGD